jgi:hypothetical protein
MKSFERLNKLADKFEIKLEKHAGNGDVQMEQSGTTELFFGSADTQQAFAKAIGELGVQGNKVVGTGPVAKILADFRNKTEQAASFSMDITAEPNKGAAFKIDVNPPSLKAPIMNALSGLYNSIVKKPMSSVQKEADQKAKSGGGSGTNHVQDLSVE